MNRIERKKGRGREGWNCEMNVQPLMLVLPPIQGLQDSVENKEC